MAETQSGPSALDRSPPPSAEQLRIDLAAAREDLARLCGDLRVQLNLAREEAEDLWRAVEPPLKTAGHRLADAEKKRPPRVPMRPGFRPTSASPRCSRAGRGSSAPSPSLSTTSGARHRRRARASMRRRGGPSGDDEAETLGERAVTGRQRATDQLDHQTKATLDELRGALGRLRTAFRADGDDDDGDRTTGPARPPSGGARPRVFVRSGHEVLAGSVRDLVNVVAPGSAIAVSVLYLKRPGVRFG
ncbi:MAG: hypothetical protein FJ306_15140, partial [Planctomycetes bacterium]|nr:hypothetical protein [Planctomycetota bacterium]